MSAESEIERAYAGLLFAYTNVTQESYAGALNSTVGALQRCARATAAGADINDVAPIFLAASNLLRVIGEVADDGVRISRSVAAAEEFATRGINDPFFAGVKRNSRR